MDVGHKLFTQTFQTSRGSTPSTWAARGDSPGKTFEAGCRTGWTPGQFWKGAVAEAGRRLCGQTRLWKAASSGRVPGDDRRGSSPQRGEVLSAVWNRRAVAQQQPQPLPPLPPPQPMNCCVRVFCTGRPQEGSSEYCDHRAHCTPQSCEARKGVCSVLSLESRALGGCGGPQMGQGHLQTAGTHSHSFQPKTVDVTS